MEAMEKAQEHSERADNNISDAAIVNIGTKAMLSSVQFPKANDDWEDLPKKERTWPK